MMVNEFLTKENWITGESALDDKDKPIPYYKYEAEKFDIKSAFRLHYKGEAYDEAVNRFKAAYKAAFPDKYKACRTVFDSFTGIRAIYPLYKLNDQLTFEDLQRIFAITDV